MYTGECCVYLAFYITGIGAFMPTPYMYMPTPHICLLVRHMKFKRASTYSCEPAHDVRFFPLRTYNTRTMQIHMTQYFPGIIF